MIGWHWVLTFLNCWCIVINFYQCTFLIFNFCMHHYLELNYYMNDEMFNIAASFSILYILGFFFLFSGQIA